MFRTYRPIAPVASPVQVRLQCDHKDCPSLHRLDDYAHVGILLLLCALWLVQQGRMLTLLCLLHFPLLCCPTLLLNHFSDLWCSRQILWHGPMDGFYCLPHFTSYEIICLHSIVQALHLILIELTLGKHILEIDSRQLLASDIIQIILTIRNALAPF